MSGLLVRQHRQDFEHYFYLTVGKHSVTERWSSLNQVSVDMRLIPTVQLSICFYLQFILRTNKLFSTT